MAMNDRPITRMMMQNSAAHIICLNEANAFLSPQDEKSKDRVKTFIRFGYKGIVIKQWSSKPIACFVRGGPSARVELLARHISTKSQNWGTTFGMFRCFFGPVFGISAMVLGSEEASEHTECSFPVLTLCGNVERSFSEARLREHPKSALRISTELILTANKTIQ